MPSLNLLFSKWRESTIIILLSTAFILFQKWRLAEIQLQEANLSYKNPAVKFVDHVIYKEGPVRIRTVIIKQKSGDEITTIDENRDEASAIIEALKESTPVPLSKILTPKRQNRYLLTLGLNRLTSDLDGKALFVGYGINNRLDVQVGGIDHDGFSPWLLTTIRF